MIPKRIFYVWGADEPKRRDVLACMQSWRQVCSGYEIIEINENSVDYFNFQKELNHSKWFKSVYDRRLWAYVADYIRIKVLYENGGIYLDTDVSVLKNFDPFLNLSAFVGLQSELYVEPAILGATKGNHFLKQILDFYDDGIWKEPIFTMPQIFQKFFVSLYGVNNFPPKMEQNVINLKDIVVFPERYFIPFRYQEQFTPDCVESDTVTIHWFGGSWLNEQALKFLQNKHQCGDSGLIENKKITIQTNYSLFKLIPLLKVVDDGSKCRVYLFNKMKVCSFNRDSIRLLGIRLITIKRL